MSNNQTSINIRLSFMFFMQCFVWSTWFNTMGACFDQFNIGSITAASYSMAPIAAMIAPLFLGLIADRFYSSQKVMAVLFFIGGVAIYFIPQEIAKGAEHAKQTVPWLVLLNLLCYMPTLGLANSVAFANIEDQQSFPRLRVWGTIGWIAAGLVVANYGLSADPKIFTFCTYASVAMGIFCFFLPHTPPPAKGQPFKLSTLFMVDAFGMLKKSSFLIFIICCVLICAPVAYYYANTGSYLTAMGFLQPAGAMTIGQMSEIIFMLLIPFFFRRLGVKGMLLVGMLAWSSRYALFAIGAPSQIGWMIYLGIALHGICYDFFFVTGFIYADKASSPQIRNQVQSLLIFFTQGVGMFIGYRISGFMKDKTLVDHAEFVKAIGSAAPPAEKGLLGGLKNVFGVDLPINVDLSLLTKVAEQWKTFWLVPAGMALGAAIIFLLAFHDRSVSVKDSDIQH